MRMRVFSCFAMSFLATVSLAQTISLKPGTYEMGCTDMAAITSATSSQIFAGDFARLEVGLKNPCTLKSATIHWRIIVPGSVLREGDVTVPAGGTSIVSTLWRRPTVGTFSWRAEITAPDDSVTSNNGYTASLSVVAPEKVVRVLDRYLAKEAGFYSNPDPGLQCSLQTLPPPAAGASVKFEMPCAAGTSLIGGKASPEAFANGYKLKNGWVVYGIERIGTPPACESDQFCGAQFEVAPQAGSSSPYTKMRIWASACCSASYVLRIKIIGYQNTDPYNCQIDKFDCNTGLPIP